MYVTLYLTWRRMRMTFDYLEEISVRTLDDIWSTTGHNATRVLLVRLEYGVSFSDEANVGYRAAKWAWSLDSYCHAPNNEYYVLYNNSYIKKWRGNIIRKIRALHVLHVMSHGITVRN